LPEVVAGLREGDSGVCIVGDAGGDVVDFCTGLSGLEVIIVIREYYVAGDKDEIVFQL